MNNLSERKLDPSNTISTRVIAEVLGRQHSNIKISAERRLGKSYCNSISNVFVHKNNEYEEYMLDLDSAANLITQLSTRSRAINSLEETALSTIEQILGVNLVRQFFVGNYRIDGYDVINKIAYEVDEQHHKNRKPKDLNRQREIEEILGCTFVRITV